MVHQDYDDEKVKRYMKKLFDKRREEKLGNLRKELEKQSQSGKSANSASEIGVEEK